MQTAGWGKRGWQNLKTTWGKRTQDWQNLHSSWGKRQGWQKLNGGWGKRGWKDMQSSGWGKRFKDQVGHIHYEKIKLFLLHQKISMWVKCSNKNQNNKLVHFVLKNSIKKICIYIFNSGLTWLSGG